MSLTRLAQAMHTRLPIEWVLQSRLDAIDAASGLPARPGGIAEAGTPSIDPPPPIGSFYRGERGGNSPPVLSPVAGFFNCLTLDRVMA